MPVKRYNGTSWDVIAGDGAAGAPGTNGTSYASGGTAGQVLSKIDSTNYNTQWITPKTSRFVLTGERNGSPVTATYFAFGNGVSARNDVVLPYSCTLDALSAFANTAFTGTFTFQVLKNNTSVASLSITSGNTTNYSTGANVSFSAGDTIALYCSAGDVGGTVVTVNAWFLS